MSSSSDDDSDSSSGSDSSFDVDFEPKTYDDHVKLIEHLDEVTEKRHARERMWKEFPLSEGT